MAVDIQSLIRREIERRGLTQYRISKECGISQSVLSTFLNGQGLNLANAETLLDYLGFKIVRKKTQRK
jgi:transcriptional regulator with XRE-family HTH domain